MPPVGGVPDPSAVLNGAGMRIEDTFKHGLISTFGRTGNPLLDTMLCCLIPLLVSVAFSQLGTLQEYWRTTAFPMLMKLLGLHNDNKVKVFTRVLTSRKDASSGPFYYNQQQQTDKTKQLMTAISLYIKSLKKAFQSADVSLIDIEDGAANKPPFWHYHGNQQRGEDKKDAFANHEILWEPINGLWIEVADQVQYMRQLEVHEQGGDRKDLHSGGGEARNTVTFHFRSTAPDGDQRIDAFLNEAFAWYKGELDKRKDNTRFFYNYAAKEFSEANRQQNYNYKRFALSDDKDFDSIFFPAKDELLGLLENFKGKTGRYSIKGSAHKLGLLLHGPPGTGKTSFIKALAKHFNRHIVAIPLARIETNEELIDLMFDLNFRVHGCDFPVKLTHKEILWVFEDVDAASDVVHRRAPAAKASKTTTTIIRTEHVVRKPDATSAAAGGGGEPIERGTSSSSTGGKFSEPLASPRLPLTSPRQPVLQEGEELVTTVVKEVTKEDNDSEDEEEPRAPPRRKGRTPLDLEDDDDDEDEDDLLGEGKGEDKGDPKKKGKMGPKWYEPKDKLNLAGLLEVLDGVVDTPNRLVILTSNHPEKLDPALIRPGRIDKKIKLDFLRPREALQMAEHFLGPLAEQDKAGLAAVINSQGEHRRVITPAVLEQACTENETAPALIKALQLMVKQGTDSL